MNGPLTLRPPTDADLDFLHRLYATTREDELAQVAWTPEQKAAFVAQQFHAQHHFWREKRTASRTGASGAQVLDHV